DQPRPGGEPREDQGAWRKPPPAHLPLDRPHPRRARRSGSLQHGGELRRVGARPREPERAAQLEAAARGRPLLPGARAAARPLALRGQTTPLEPSERLGALQTPCPAPEEGPIRPPPPPPAGARA